MERHPARPAPRPGVRPRRGRRAGHGLLQGGGEGGFQRGRSRLIREQIAGEGLARNPGRDLKGERDLGERHLFDFAVAEALEEAEDGTEEFLAGDPFVFPEFATAAGPIGGGRLREGGLGGDLGLKQAGLTGEQAVAPVILAGPIFHGGRIFAEDLRDGRKRAGLAQLEEGEESPEGARGLAGAAGEGVGGEAAGGSEHSTFNIERPTSNEGGTGDTARREHVVLVFMDTASHNSVASAREKLYIYFNIHL